MVNGIEQTDKELYDMAEHLKECYDVMESKMNEYKNENFELKKQVMMNYSLFRLLSNIIEEADIDFSITNLIEIGRTFNSENIDEFIFN